MNQEKFMAQVERLKAVYGDKAYPQERMRVLFNAIKEMPDHWMENSVNDFIANNRQAPLLAEFIKKVDEHRQRLYQENQQTQLRGGGSFASTLGEASRSTKNKEFAKACLETLHLKQQGKTSTEEFLGRCDLLDQAANQLNPQGRKSAIHD